MSIHHERDFVVRDQYAFRSDRIDPRIRHNDFQYANRRGQRSRENYSRYQFSPADFYNSIQREGRAYDLAANYRRHDISKQKTFNRADDRIADDIYVALTDHPDIDATEILIDVKDAHVTLSGYVTSRYEKRLAVDLCENIRGVRDVENSLRVQPSLRGSSTQGD